MSGCNAQAILDAQPDMTLEQVEERMAPYADRVRELLRRYPIKRGALLQLLWLVQEEFGWVPRITIKWAARHAEVSPVHAFGVVEFYTMYKQAPVGRYFLQVCEGPCCYIQGGEELISHLETKLGIHAGETTEDGLFTLVRVQCLAACGNGPAVLVNDEFLYGSGELNELELGFHPTPEVLDGWLERLRKEAEGQPEPVKIDALGGQRLDTAGHPGGAGATGSEQPKDYAPPPPALQVAGETKAGAVTITCLCAPETTTAQVERSDDDGKTWKQVGEVDVTAMPGVPGPPGGPKQVSWEGALAIGDHASFRLITAEGDRVARPSASVAVVGQSGGDTGSHQKGDD